MTWLHVILIGGCAASTVFIGRWIKRICEAHRSDMSDTNGSGE